MILPVPGPADQVKVGNFSLKQYAKFFRDLDTAFDQLTGRLSMNTAATFGMSKGATRGPIEVIQQGNYNVSIVPTVDDFERLDASLAKGVNKELFKLLSSYDSRFCFVVAKFRETQNEELKFHPLCINCPMLPVNLPADVAEVTPQMKQALVGDAVMHTMFIPTMHYHHGESIEPYVDDWDHKIFLMHGVPHLTKEQQGTPWIAGDDLLSQFGPRDMTADIMKLSQLYHYVKRYLLPTELIGKWEWNTCTADHFQRCNIKGYFPNKDMYAIPVYPAN